MRVDVIKISPWIIINLNTFLIITLTLFVISKYNLIVTIKMIPKSLCWRTEACLPMWRAQYLQHNAAVSKKMMILQYSQVTISGKKRKWWCIYVQYPQVTIITCIKCLIMFTTSSEFPCTVLTIIRFELLCLLNSCWS